MGCIRLWFLGSLCCVLIGALPDAWIQLLAYDRLAILEQGQCWRLWSAHVTHFSWSQLLVDTGMFAALGYILRTYVTDTCLLKHMAWAMPLILIGLIVWMPNVQCYRGLSALVSMMWLMLACFIWQHAKGRSLHTLLAAGLLGLFVVRLLLDARTEHITISHLPMGVLVLWQVHVLGALAGVIAWYLSRTSQPSG
ncbi:MAG: hypothetical protein Q9M18_02520 [Mariprofundaceae bacterium]|nr:hypothetical protein [Mariprofundaceae bacterium]